MATSRRENRVAVSATKLLVCPVNHHLGSAEIAANSNDRFFFVDWRGYYQPGDLVSTIVALHYRQRSEVFCEATEILLDCLVRVEGRCWRRRVRVEPAT